MRTARDYLDGLAKEAGDDPALRRELAVAYARLGDVQMEHLSEYGRDVIGALASQRKSLDLFTALAAALPNNAQAQRDLEASRGKIADLERACVAGRGERPDVNRADDLSPAGSHGPLAGLRTRLDVDQHVLDRGDAPISRSLTAWPTPCPSRTLASGFTSTWMSTRYSSPVLRTSNFSTPKTPVTADASRRTSSSTSGSACRSINSCTLPHSKAPPAQRTAPATARAAT